MLKRVVRGISLKPETAVLRLSIEQGYWNTLWEMHLIGPRDELGGLENPCVRLKFMAFDKEFLGNADCWEGGHRKKSGVKLVTLVNVIPAPKRKREEDGCKCEVILLCIVSSASAKVT